MANWHKALPEEPGWYWHLQDDGDVCIYHVFQRPGHSWLCVEGDPYGPMQKRNFIALKSLGGLWSDQITPPYIERVKENDKG